MSQDGPFLGLRLERHLDLHPADPDLHRGARARSCVIQPVTHPVGGRLRRRITRERELLRDATGPSAECAARVAFGEELDGRFPPNRGAAPAEWPATGSSSAALSLI
jgi:hypothetical protein